MGRAEGEHGGLGGAARRLRERAASSAFARRARRPLVWGTLRRSSPLDLPGRRGEPVWEHLVADVLRTWALHPTGAVLVERDRRFVPLLAAEGTVDVVDVDPHNPAVTLLADLADAGAVAAGAYGLVLVTHATERGTPVPDVLATAWAAVAPGGILVVAAKALPDPEPPRWQEAPSAGFLGAGRLRQELAALDPAAESVEVVARGGFTAAVAHLGGIAADELRAEELAGGDERYAVAVVGRAVKRATAGAPS